MTLGRKARLVQKKMGNKPRYGRQRTDPVSVIASGAVDGACCDMYDDMNLCYCDRCRFVVTMEWIVCWNNPTSLMAQNMFLLMHEKE